jgi:hypothetical protein
MSDYAYWRAKLAGDPVEFIDAEQCGFWRKRPFRGAAWQPVAIFKKGDEIVCLVGDRIRPGHEVWSPFLEPVSEAAYRLAIVSGRFGDDHDTHRHAPTAHALTTELTLAKPVSPIVSKS